MRVYIAGPISIGDHCENMYAAYLATEQVLQAGHAPYLPHLWDHFYVSYVHPYDKRIALDMEWLALCHAIIRLPGVSAGSDSEVARAEELGLPIFYSVESFLDTVARGL